MTDGPFYGTSRYSATDDDTVELIAARVLSVLVKRAGNTGLGADETYLSRLCDAVRAINPDAQNSVFDDMIADGIETDAIADVYIPIVARRLGAAWCEDQVSFADVTIGTSRLQSMLRGLGGAWSGDIADPQDVPASVLMIVPADEYHTLGAMVATGQLRRAGLSVRLCIGHSTGLVLDLVETYNFDAIMISGANSGDLENLRRLVLNIKEALLKPTPIVVGGAVLDLAGDVKATTGADHVSNDINEALGLCGLKTSEREGGFSKLQA